MNIDSVLPDKSLAMTVATESWILELTYKNTRLTWVLDVKKYPKDAAKNSNLYLENKSSVSFMLHSDKCMLSGYPCHGIFFLFDYEKRRKEKIKIQPIFVFTFQFNEISEMISSFEKIWFVFCLIHFSLTSTINEERREPTFLFH